MSKGWQPSLQLDDVTVPFVGPDQRRDAERYVTRKCPGDAALLLEMLGLGDDDVADPDAGDAGDAEDPTTADG